MSTTRLYELLERIGNLLRAEERRVGGEHELLPVHLHVVGYLARCNRYSDTPAAVTEYLGITKGTVSQTLRRLAERGLVKSRRDLHDKRKSHLQLTARGRRIAQATIPPPEVAAALDQPDARQSEKILTELLLALQQAHGTRAFGVCHSCRHFRRDRDGFRCGLTQEPLSQPDSQLICREHERAS